MRLIEFLKQDIASLHQQGLYRQRKTIHSACNAHVQVGDQTLINFASNDYLGFASHPRLIQALQEGAEKYGVGSGGSHLLGGHSIAHTKLEESLAEFSGGFTPNPRALFFSTGYLANLAIITSLASSETHIFSDELNHASLIDAIRLSKAQKYIYPHQNIEQLAQQLAQSTALKKIIVTDAVFSMDGDTALLKALLDLAKTHQAWLIVDDAHGFGVLGKQGRGSLDANQLYSSHLIYMGTLGKAAGVSGAFVIAEKTVIDYLIQTARSYIYTTASSPALAHTVNVALSLISSQEGDERQSHLKALIHQTQRLLKHYYPQSQASETAIQILITGSNQATLNAMSIFQQYGLWAPAIRPPTVPPHQSRLRLSLSANHQQKDIQILAQALEAFTSLKESI